MTPLVLDDIRVLDLSQGIAGPLCAKILADFGADVVKVEPPGGEAGRRMPPFFHDEVDTEKSLFFLLANLNKRGVSLNLETSEGVALFKRLVREVDVVVESFPPGYLTNLGLDHTSLQAENPGLTMTSITPFGQTGPYCQYKGEEIVGYAMSGLMSISGTSDREPLKHGGFQSQYEGGLNGALATLVSLTIRDLTGIGQHVDVSILEVLASTLVIQQSYYSWSGAVQGRRASEGSSFGQIMPCKDGYFVSQVAGAIEWETVANFFGREILKEERFADSAQRGANGLELERIVLDASKDRTMAEMFKTASEQYRLLFGIVQTPADLAECAQLEARDFYQDVKHPVIGDIKVPSRLWNMSESSPGYRRPAPMIGEHNGEIYGNLLGLSEEQIADLRQSRII